MTRIDGTIDLFLPTDLVDLAQPGDEDAARGSYEDLARQVFPTMEPAARGQLVDALMGWRTLLADRGVVLHGLVSVPADGDVAAANWHLLAGVVDVPEAGELDAGVVCERYLRQKVDPDRVYTESFATDMGWGVGVITEVDVVPPPELLPLFSVPPRVGLAAALAAPPDSELGLLVLGFAFELEHHLEMAGVVAAIAGRSRLAAVPAGDRP